MVAEQEWDSTVVSIYALHEPGDPAAVRYIGSTRKPSAVRLTEHLRWPGWGKDKSARWLWIASLRAHGLAPGIRVLDTCSEAQRWAWEDGYTKACDSAGAVLLNGPHLWGWPAALREWLGARAAVDGAVLRYRGGDPAISARMRAQHLREALDRATAALEELRLGLEHDEEEGKP